MTSSARPPVRRASQRKTRNATRQTNPSESTDSRSEPPNPGRSDPEAPMPRTYPRPTSPVNAPVLRPTAHHSDSQTRSGIPGRGQGSGSRVAKPASGICSGRPGQRRRRAWPNLRRGCDSSASWSRPTSAGPRRRRPSACPWARPRPWAWRPSACPWAAGAALALPASGSLAGFSGFLALLGRSALALGRWLGFLGALRRNELEQRHRRGVARTLPQPS